MPEREERFTIIMALQDPGSIYAILPPSVRSRKIHPGKRTILVSCLLSFLLLMSQLLRALQLNHPPKLTNVQVLYSLTDLNVEAEVATCMKTYLGKEKHSIDSSMQTCQQLIPSRGLCSLTQDLFFNKKPPDCAHQKRVTFCILNKSEVSCKVPNICADFHLYIGEFSEELAKIKWAFVSVENLQSEVSNYISKHGTLGFIFIKCSMNSEPTEDFGQPQYDQAYPDQVENFQIEYTQLFLFPPVLKEMPKKSKFININLLMIDSLSRAHFYRSLPETVKFLEDLKGRSSGTEILDFQMFQAVKQRTYESLQALFSGYVNTSEVPFGTYDIPNVPLPISKLYGKFKEKGYKTLWLEDLCWNWEWGLIKDLKAMNDSLDDVALWHNFKKRLKAASIDSIDMTVASCDILAANGKKDPFRGLPVVCYNGRHHHEYILDYLQLYHAAFQDAEVPFITYASTSVSHDESGIRVQTLDRPLSEYLKSASTLENTLTIVFSDHGNTYGKFIESSPEAHAETFNPALFMIVPLGVKSVLGDVQMRILKENENHLTSLIDVHHMLLEIIHEKPDTRDVNYQQKYVIPGGLLSKFPSTRTCHDLPLLQPNLCICRGYEAVVETSSLHLVLADFGLGVLNNMILFQYKRLGRNGFGHCKPMKAAEIRKVREVHMAADLVRYKLDVVVHTAEHSGNRRRNIFFLTIEAGRTNPSIRIISYERLSAYGMYSVCRDKTVELKLCICDTESSEFKGNIFDSLILRNMLPDFSFLNEHREISDQKLIGFFVNSLLGTKAEIDFSYPSKEPCLYTVIHKYKAGIVIQALNFCSEFHKIEILVTAKNMYLSSHVHSSYILHSRDIKVLIAGIVANPKIEWNWDHSVKVY
ncbi:hypothetical protein SK128_004395 [Halocaridina rubra]|uniref:Uncharacterized protein n=1 Tax=Halocaridina rubra TaxID=373956 RepID=A0AAN8WRX5_HALRR